MLLEEFCRIVENCKGNSCSQVNFEDGPRIQGRYGMLLIAQRKKSRKTTNLGRKSGLYLTRITSFCTLT